MIRSIFTNKWIIGGVLLLILGAIAFHILLERDMANFKRQVMQQRHAIQERARAASVKKSTQEGTPAESETPSAERPSTDTEEVAPVPEGQTETEKPQQTALPAEKADEAKVAVSAFGFGPFPEVPEGMDYKPFWADPELYPHIKGSRESELISRVRIKKWEEEGERGIVGAGFYPEYNRVFLNYANTVYVTWDEMEDEDGNPIRYMTRLSGASSATNRIRANNIARLGRRGPRTEADIPPDIEVILHSEGGIDPFEYLGLNP